MKTRSKGKAPEIFEQDSQLVRKAPTRARKLLTRGTESIVVRNIATIAV